MLRNVKLGGMPAGRAKESKNRPEVKQPADDDSIFEAETQCDVDCLDVNKSSADKLHLSQEGKICVSAPDQEEDMFEGETQYEEPSFTVPVKPFSASDPKKQDLAPRQDTVDAVDDDIYEAETQCVMDDFPNKETKVDVVNKEKVVAKSINSLEQENVNICNVNQQCKTDLVAKDTDNSGSKHRDEPHSAPTQCFLGEDNETLLGGRTDAVSVCSEQTEECVYDDASLSSHEDVDIKKSAQEKVDNKDLDILTESKADRSESQVAQVPLSGKGDQEIEHPDSERDRSSADTKISLDVSYNEDSVDRSMLEGDDDLFAFEATQISGSKEGAFKTNKTTEKCNEVNQENKSKSNSKNSDDPQTDLVNLSKQRTVEQSKSEKTLSASEASEKCISDKSKSHQAQNGSVNISDIFQTKTKNTVKSQAASNKENAKLSNESGDDTDADGIVEAAVENREQRFDNKKNVKLFVELCHDSGDEKDSDAKTQIILPPVSNSKTVSKLSEPSSSKHSSETSVTINSENIKTNTQSPTHPGNSATEDRNIEKQNKVMKYESENNRGFTELKDSAKRDVSHALTDKPAVVSSEKGKVQTWLSIESKDDNNSDDDDDVIFGAPTQILFPANRNRDFKKPPASLRKKATDITAINSSSSVKVPAQLNSAFEDHDHGGDDDSIFEVATQIVGNPNEGSKDFTKSLTVSPVEEKPNIDHDDDNDIYEAATQIVATPNNSNKDFTKPFAASPIADKADAEHDDSDSIFEAATQIAGTPNNSNKDFTKSLPLSPVEEKPNADHDDDNDIYEAATQIVATPNNGNKDFTKPFAPSPVEDKADAQHDDSDSIFEAATQMVENPIRSGKDFTETRKHSSGNDTADIQAITDDCKVKKLHSSSGSVDEDMFECPVDSCSDIDMANICSASAQKVNFPENRISELQERDPSASRGSCSVMPKAQGHCVNKSEMVGLNQNVPVQDSTNTALITPKLQFDAVARTKRDCTISGDDESSELKQTKASEDKIVSVEKDADENHRMVESEEKEMSHTNEGGKPGPKDSKRQEATRRDDGKKAVTVESKKQGSAHKDDGAKPVAAESEKRESSRKHNKGKHGTAESKKQQTSCRGDGRKHRTTELKRRELFCKDDQGETVTTESNKSRDAPAYAQRGGDEKSVMAKSLRAGDGTVCSQKCGMKGTKEAHGTVARAQRNGSEEPGVEDSKKPDVPTVDLQKGNGAVHGMAEPEKQRDCKAESGAGTHRDSDGSSGLKESELPDDNTACGQRYLSGEPVISDSKKPSNISSAQKVCGQEPGMAGSEVVGDPHLCPCDDSGDETDPEHVFEADSHKIKMERNSNKLNTVQISALPLSSEETAEKIHKSEVICIEDKDPSSASLVFPQDTVLPFVSGTKDRKRLTQVAESVDTAVPIQSTKVSTKPISADISCGKETSTVSLAAGSNNSDLLIVPASECNIATDEKIDASKAEESSDQSVGESSVLEVSTSSITNTVASPLSQYQITKKRVEGVNSDLQAGTPSDHKKDRDGAEKTPLGSLRIEPDHESLEPKDSTIQKEYDPKSHPDINQQTPLENERSVFEEAEPIRDSLNDTQDLLMPSMQDLLEAVKKSEAQESPLKPEELIRSEGDEPDPTTKTGRHSHLPNKSTKVRKRLNVDSRRSDTAVGASRRRGIHYEDSVQSDKSNITFRASKRRKLSDKDSVQNDSKNKAGDVTFQSRADESAEEIQQNETEDVVNTNDVNICKGRKSKIVAARSKGQGKAVSLLGLQKDIKGSGAERASRSKVERKEKDLTSEQSDEPRGGRSSLKQVAKSTKDNDHEELRKSRRERSVNKNENTENSAETSSRPSRQRKMTWKIRDSLGADSSQGGSTPGGENSRNRSRGSSSSNSQNEINESLELTDTTVRPRNASLSKSPSKKLLKNFEDSGNNTHKEVKEIKETNSVSVQQIVSLRKSTRQSKRDFPVTSVTDPSKIQSPQRRRRQNDRKEVSNNVQKRKNEEVFSELSSKRYKRENKVSPVEKSQRNSTDKCSPKASKSVLNTDDSFEDVSELNTRASGRKGRRTAGVGLLQEQADVITNISTVVTENQKQSPVFKKTSSSVGSVEGCAGRRVRNRLEVTNTSPSSLKEVNASESLNASSRTQRGVKRRKPSVEEDSGRLPVKQAKSEKRLSQPHSSPSESSTQNAKVESRASRTRGKLETRGMTKQDTKPGQRERTSRISEAEETDKCVTPSSRKMNLSEGQDTTPKRTRSSRGKGTPQSNSQLNSQKVNIANTVVC
jgi:hypothetical protein